MIWWKRPDIDYASREFQRLMQLIPRWARDRTPSVTTDEIYKITLFSFAFFGNALSRTSMRKQDIEGFAANGVLEICSEFSKSLDTVQTDFDSIVDIHKGSSYFGDAAGVLYRQWPAGSTQIDHDDFVVICSSACAGIIKKFQADGWISN